MKKILIFLFILFSVGLLQAQETRIINPWVKGKLKFQNNYLMWDSVNDGIKINGKFRLQNELWINSFQMRDSGNFIILNKTPKFSGPVNSWITDNLVLSISGTKILDSTITVTKLHPDLISKIFSDTITMKGLTTLYNSLLVRYNLLHDAFGNLRSIVFPGVVSYYVNPLTPTSPGRVLVNIDNSLDTTGGVLKINSVDGYQIVVGSISGEKLIDGTIYNDKLQYGSVDSNKILYHSVSNNNLALNSVKGENIRDNSIDEKKIIMNAITEDKIDNYSVTNSKLAPNAVSRNKILDGEVTSNKLDTANIKGARVISGTLYIPTFISWLTRNVNFNEFITRNPNDGSNPDNVGYIFPRGGKILSITSWNGEIYSAKLNLDVDFDAFSPIRIVYMDGGEGNAYLLINIGNLMMEPLAIAPLSKPTQVTLEVVIF